MTPFQILIFLLLTLTPNVNSYIAITQTLNWTAAEEYCIEKYNSHLASIHSLSENTEVVSLITDMSWIGFNDIAVESTWVWTDASSNTFSNWYPGVEPSQYSQSGEPEHCVWIYRDSGDRGTYWNDGPCSYLKPFVCNDAVSTYEPTTSEATTSEAYDEPLFPSIFDDISTEQGVTIGWIEMFSCKEGYTTDGTNIQKISPNDQPWTDLLQFTDTAITAQIISSGTKPSEYDFTNNPNDPFAVMTKICSNPVLALNNRQELSYVIDTISLAAIAEVNLDDWMGSNTAKKRLPQNTHCHICVPQNGSLSKVVYRACCNTKGIHLNLDCCEWDYRNNLANTQGIAFWIGFDIDRQNCCVVENGNIIYSECTKTTITNWKDDDIDNNENDETINGNNLLIYVCCGCVMGLVLLCCICYWRTKKKNKNVAKDNNNEAKPNNASEANNIDTVKSNEGENNEVGEIDESIDDQRKIIIHLQNSEMNFEFPILYQLDEFDESLYADLIRAIKSHFNYNDCWISINVYENVNESNICIDDVDDLIDAFAANNDTLELHLYVAAETIV